MPTTVHELLHDTLPNFDHTINHGLALLPQQAEVLAHYLYLPGQEQDGPEVRRLYALSASEILVIEFNLTRADFEGAQRVQSLVINARIYPLDRVVGIETSIEIIMSLEHGLSNKTIEVTTLLFEQPSGLGPLKLCEALPHNQRTDVADYREFRQTVYEIIHPVLYRGGQ